MKEERLHGFKTILVVWPIMWALGFASVWAVIKQPDLITGIIAQWGFLIIGFGAGYGASKVSSGYRDKLRQRALDEIIDSQDE